MTNELVAIAKRILDLRDPRKRLARSLFGAQRLLFEDNAAQKAACCTRRAGKSHVAGSALIDAALATPNVDTLYLGLTRRSSKSIMWPKFSEINQLLLGKPLQLKESELLVTTPNNSRVWVMGADMENLADRLRGNKYARVIIDEAQSFGSHLQYLIDDVLEPALLDLQGDLWLLGTPGPIPTGIFYEAMVSPMSTFSQHSWSLLDNPHLPHAKQWLETLKKRKGWTDENPTYRREYLGQWCHDADALVYKYSASRNKADKLPDGHVWHYVIGLDYGWNDATAFSILAYSPTCLCAYIVENFASSQMTPSRIGEKLLQLIDKYEPEAIVADTGGLGKSITEEMKNRFGIPVKAAEKTDKMAFIATMNGDFIDGRIKILPGNEALEHQYMTLQYDDKHKEDPNLPNDRCVAEGTRICTEFGYVPIENIKPGWNVWTRQGWKRVLRKIYNGERETLRIQTSNGSFVECTHDHKVYTVERGFIRADSVLYGYRMEAIQWRVRSTKESFSEDIQNQSLGLCKAIFTELCGLMAKVKWFFCIGMFGNKRLARYLKGITYTTRMAIRLTTVLIILSACLAKSIMKCTRKIDAEGLQQRKQLHTLTLSESLQKPGMLVQRASNGIVRTLKHPWLSACKRKLSTSVQSVAQLIFGLLKPLAIGISAQISATRETEENQVWTTSKRFVHGAVSNSLLPNMELKTYAVEVVAVEEQSIRRVWDLEVEDAHEFYANGLLIHNCDSTLYGYRYLRHYLSTERQPAPVIGSDNWNKQQEQLMLESIHKEKTLMEELEDVWQ